MNEGQDFLWKLTHMRVNFYFELNGKKDYVKNLDHLQQHKRFFFSLFYFFFPSVTSSFVLISTFAVA